MGRVTVLAVLGAGLLAGCGESRHSIEGKVFGTGSTPITMTLSGGSTLTTTTDPDGMYRFQDVPDGGYTITPSRQGWTFAPLSVTFTLRGSDILIPGGFLAEPPASP